ncbi:MAG: hypothetical protein NTW41_11765 [Verrucomicrobia bacterium]|nr:hypothetical protein [Verrucomicrobiota bacterium]
MIEKKGVRAGGLESGAELAGKKVMAVALEDTDGSASHPYQFFSRKRFRAGCQRVQKELIIDILALELRTKSHIDMV